MKKTYYKDMKLKDKDIWKDFEDLMNNKSGIVIKSIRPLKKINEKKKIIYKRTIRTIPKEEIDTLM